MSDTLKQAITDVRRKRYDGQDSEHAFVTGDVASGDVREQKPDRQDDPQQG